MRAQNSAACSATSLARERTMSDDLDDLDDLNARRERVVQVVLDRIRVAPAPTLGERSPMIDVAAWSVPALAAAVVIIIVSGAAVLMTKQKDPDTVIESLGLPRQVTQYLETGRVPLA